jgi:hypothetical protein
MISAGSLNQRLVRRLNIEVDRARKKAERMEECQSLTQADRIQPDREPVGTGQICSNINVTRRPSEIGPTGTEDWPSPTLSGFARNTCFC